MKMQDTTSPYSRKAQKKPENTGNPESRDERADMEGYRSNSVFFGVLRG
jgi:hypothetical protein